MKSLVALFLFALSVCVVASASSNEETELTESQKAKVAEIVEQFRNQCKAGPALPENATKAMKMMNAWATDPAGCNCSAERLRARFSPKVLEYTQVQMNQLKQQFAEVDVAECGVPIMKGHLSKSCEPFLESAFGEMAIEQKERRVQELGYKDFQVMIKETCDCVRTTIKDVTPSQWVSSSMAGYREYLQRKQAGLSTGTGPATPMDSAMSTCMRNKQTN